MAKIKDDNDFLTQTLADKQDNSFLYQPTPPPPPVYQIPPPQATVYRQPMPVQPRRVYTQVRPQQWGPAQQPVQQQPAQMPVTPAYQVQQPKPYVAPTASWRYQLNQAEVNPTGNMGGLAPASYYAPPGQNPQMPRPAMQPPTPQYPKLDFRTWYQGMAPGPYPSAPTAPAPTSQGSRIYAGGRVPVGMQRFEEIRKGNASPAELLYNSAYRVQEHLPSPPTTDTSSAAGGGYGSGYGYYPDYGYGYGGGGGWGGGGYGDYSSKFWLNPSIWRI